MAAPPLLTFLLQPSPPLLESENCFPRDSFLAYNQWAWKICLKADLTSQCWSFIFLSKQAGLQEATTKSLAVFMSLQAVDPCPPSVSSECWRRKPKTAKTFPKSQYPASQLITVVSRWGYTMGLFFIKTKQTTTGLGHFNKCLCACLLLLSASVAFPWILNALSQPQSDRKPTLLCHPT